MYLEAGCEEDLGAPGLVDHFPDLAADGVQHRRLLKSKKTVMHELQLHGSLWAELQAEEACDCHGSLVQLTRFSWYSWWCRYRRWVLSIPRSLLT